MILVHRKIEQQFIDEFRKVTERIRVGHPTLAKPEPFMGPLIDEAAVKMYFDFCEAGVREGAEEIFGPNCFFIPYDDIEEAIKIVNCTPYGLAASVFTRDNDIYKLCLRDIESGLLNLNRSTVGATARLPFGGVKNSGNHRPAAVSMVDHCVHAIASLETTDDNSSKLTDVVGLVDSH
jgi:succinylglutamic semialdehyde dehydrogenase